MKADPQKIQAILALADGVRCSREIAAQLGLSARYVRRVVARHGAPKPKHGAQFGERNPSWAGGRSIDLDGYASVPTPEDHPGGRKIGRILQHRLVMEQKLGRQLLETEVVDHIDGLTLHNAPSNLRVFDSNADHLRETLQGKCPNISDEGWRNVGTRTDLGATCQPVDNYQKRAKLGEIRLRQILLAALSLGTDSPHLLGTHRHLEQAQIDWSSRSSLRRALDDLYRKWGWDPAP